MIEIFDDAIDDAYYEGIEDFMLGDSISWACSGRTEEYSYGLSHTFVYFDQQNPQSYNFFLPLFLMINSKIKGSGLIRARAELTMHTNKSDHVPHVDFSTDNVHNISVILYVGEAKGPTTIYDQRLESIDKNGDQTIPDELTIAEVVEHRRNRIVAFSGNHWHSGPEKVSSGRRVIINSNYKFESDNKFGYNIGTKQNEW